METRRDFLTKMLIAGGMLTIRTGASADQPVRRPMVKDLCTVYRSVNGSPAQNMTRVLEMMGGIERLVGEFDIVLIKPNVQWWNQGAPNLLALKTLVDLIMERPGGFRGEVIVAENCHRGKDPGASLSSGWAQRFERNADMAGVANMNELAALLKRAYGKRFSVCHLIDVACGSKRVYGPWDGAGYVYCDGTGGIPLLSCDNGAKGIDRRKTIMTYPIIVTDMGTTVDFKNGIWEKGSYTERPFRCINLAALNHHSSYCGVTSAVKNHMGLSDLSGGSDPHQNGRLTGEYYNFHSFPFDRSQPGPVEGMLGKEIGLFMKTIRRADLNITTAEWVGLSSRTDPPVARTRAMLASTDPVALDYHGAKYVLYPNSKIPIHDPDNVAGPLHRYLAKCAAEYGGFSHEENVSVSSFDFSKNTFQDDSELAVAGETYWGRELKPIMKYLFLRYLNGRS